jgi:O-antigen/teichoic acid export membrane protein
MYFFKFLTIDPSQLSFKHRILNAGLWSSGSFILSMFLRLGSSMLMTRLLLPEMFGVMTIATTVMVGLGMFSDVGLRQSVIQSHRGGEAAYLNTAWTVQVIRGGLLWLIALATSVAIYAANLKGYVPRDSVYAAESLPFVIAALSFSAFIGGFESTKLLEASRKMSIGSVTRIDILSQIISLIFMISYAYVTRSIWALVVGSLTGSFVRTTLSHALLDGISNRWAWDKSAAYDLVRLGKWIFIASILGFLVNNGDRLLLGGLVTATTLGLYSIASLIATSIEGVLSRIMGDVAFPAFSEVVRERPADLKKVYYRFLMVIAPISYFMAGSLMTFGQSVVNLLYDNRYEQAGWMLQMLSAILLTIPFRLSTQSFLALGRPSLQTNIVLARLIVLFAATPIMSHFYGLPAAVLAIVVSHFVSVPIVIAYNIRHQLFDARKELFMVGFVLAGLLIGKLFSWALLLFVR